MVPNMTPTDGQSLRPHAADMPLRARRQPENPCCTAENSHFFLLRVRDLMRFEPEAFATAAYAHRRMGKPCAIVCVSINGGDHDPPAHRGDSRYRFGGLRCRRACPEIWPKPASASHSASPRSRASRTPTPLRLRLRLRRRLTIPQLHILLLRAPLPSATSAFTSPRSSARYMCFTPLARSPWISPSAPPRSRTPGADPGRSPA